MSNYLSLLVFFWLGFSGKVTFGRLAWTNIQTSMSRDQLDLWTQTSSGCTCPSDVLDHSCACCISNGCLCGGTSQPRRCGQCGLEAHCDNMCNVTISSADIKARSGQAFGEIKSPTTLSGPAFCWYRLEAEAGERVEVQIYRIKRLGELNTETNRCVGGHLQLRSARLEAGSEDSEELEDMESYDPDELAICGPNERYAPPIVMFKDSASANSASAALLLFRVEETTSRSQFLAHFAFPSVDNEETGVALKGATKLEGDCSWKFEESRCRHYGGGPNACQIASPGYPGIYSPNKRCSFHVEASSKDVRIQVTFTRFNLPPDLCETHYVEVFKGKPAPGAGGSGKSLKSLCGYVANEETVTLENGKHLTVEFVSGLITPPINYNGFTASIKFVPKKRNKNAKNSGRGNSNGNDYDGSDDDQDDDEANNKRGGRRRGDRRKDHSDGGGRRRGKKPKDSTNNNSGNSNNGCVQEFNANESRTGHISSSSLSLNNQGCTIIFRGNPGDVLMLSVNSFKLRGKGCEAFIRISQPFTSLNDRRSRQEDTEEVELICSPATRRIYDGQGRYILRPPVLVNSSTVFLQFQANRQNVDRFEAAYAFHDVRSDGLPSPNSTCDALFPGRTGHPKGTLRSPAANSDLFERVEGAFRCKKYLVPSDSQSLTLTINSANDASKHGGLQAQPAPSAIDRCETFCDERGCHCLTDQDRPFSQIDHLTVEARNGGRIACFCGSFAHLLPLNIISSSSLSLMYNVADFKAERRLAYSASYAFHNEETCGNRRISSSQGSLESPLAASPSQAYHPSSTYFHQECQWFFDTPPARQLILKISTAQKMSDCLTWNATIAIWDNGFPDQIGTLIDRFCPEISAKEYILNITARKIVISLHSLSMGPIHYRISWETTGPLSRDSTGDHPKEVIGDILMSSKASVNLWHPVLMIHLAATLIHHLGQFRLILY